MVAEMTPYEEKAKAEIEQWQSRGEGRLAKLLAPAARTVDWVYAKSPDALRHAVETAVLGALKFLDDASEWTWSKKDLAREARKVGVRFTTVEDLRSHDLEKLDQMARSYFTSNKLVAALEGAGTGMGGFALIAVDVPILFTVSFRAVRQVGATYGFDLNDPAMKPVVLSIFNAAASASPAAKAAALGNMHVVAKAFAKGWAYKKVATLGKAGAAAAALKAATKKLPQDIARNVTKRKLAQLIPFAGAAVGFGFNYWFLDRTLTTAYMTFRNLNLIEKYGRPRGVKRGTGETKPAQCRGLTKRGKRCMKVTRDRSGHCPTHRSKKKPRP